VSAVADGRSPKREAERQRALLAAIRAPVPDAHAADAAEHGARFVQGLEAYRANAAATADRALAAAFPTVRRAVGESTFAALARDHARELPPDRGDLGEWGASFPAWLDTRAALRPWPWLGDSARLDWAVHRCERAADPTFDPASWTWLASAAPERASLRFQAGTQLVRSRWPIATLHAAHRAPDPDLEAMRAALAAQRSESVLVVRAGWRASLHVVADAATLAFDEAILENLDVARALAAAGPGFDFAAWLATALRASWLQGAVRVG